MARIRLIEFEEANKETKEIYEDIIKTRKEGLSNAFKAYANNKHVLKANWEKHKTLLYSETSLPYKLKESIQLVVAKVMGCQGWINFHTKALRGAGSNEDEIENILDTNVNTPLEKAVLDYVWKSSIDPKSLNDGDFMKLKEVGLSDEQIVEMQEVIGIGLSFSTFAESLIYPA